LRMQIDAIGVELMLHELLVAALRESIDGDELNIGFDEAVYDRAIIYLRRAPERPLISHRSVLERMDTLAAQMGAKLTAGAHFVLSFPARGEEVAGLPIEINTQVLIDSDADVAPRSGHGDPRH